MSDSDEEAAFQSADEGETSEKPVKDTKTGQLKHGKVEVSSKKQGAKDQPSNKPEHRGQGSGRNKKKRGKGKVKNDITVAAKPAGDTSETPSTSAVSDLVKERTETVEVENADKATEADKSNEQKSAEVSNDTADKDIQADKGNEEKSADLTDTDNLDEIPAKLNENSNVPNENTATVVDQPQKSERPVSLESGVDESKNKQAPAMALDKLTSDENKESSGWGSWGNWGSSLLNTVQTSVDTFTHSVGEGLNTVLETAETALGAPTPEELAEKQKLAKEVKSSDALETPIEEKEEPFKTLPPQQEIIRESKDEVSEGKIEGSEGEAEGSERKAEGSEGKAEGSEGTKQYPSEQQQKDWGWGGWGLGGLTEKIQSTSKTLVSGTLDVLETVGKKTYETLAEGDHGLKQILHNKDSKTNLSQVLRDAKEKAEQDAKLEEEFVESRKAHFGAMFDEYQGLVHLEALEMLSNQCESKVHGLVTSMSGDQLQPMKKDLVAIKEAFTIEDLDDAEDQDEQDFAALMVDTDARLDVGASPDKLIKVQEKCSSWLKESFEEQEKGSGKEAKEIHQTSIQSLAELTARAVEHFHKVGELILMKKGTAQINHSRAQCLASLTRVLCTEIGIMSTKFTQCLTTAADDCEEPDSINPLITNVYLEAGNSSTYIQDAFQLLLPVLQQATIEATT